jgi:hypothetical protein
MASPTAIELLDIALKRRDELRAEVEALNKFIQDYQRLVAAQPRNDDDAVTQLNLWAGTSRRSLKSEDVALLLEEVRRLILSENRPLTRSELVRRLEDRGYKIVGRDKAKVLGTNIWRSQKFQHVEGRGYWPTDLPLPSGVDSRFG